MFICSKRFNDKNSKQKHNIKRKYQHTKYSQNSPNTFQVVSNIFLDRISHTFLEANCKLELNKNFSNMIIPSSPILLLCGNIGRPYNKLYRDFIEFCSTVFEKVFVIAGEEEYYGTKQYDKIEMLIRNITNRHTNVKYLRHESEKLNSEYDVIGTTFEAKVCRDRVLDSIDFLTQEAPPYTEEYLKGIFNRNLWELEQLIEDSKRSSKKLVIMSDSIVSFDEIADTETLGLMCKSNPFNKMDNLLRDNQNIKLWFYNGSDKGLQEMPKSCKIINGANDYPRTMERRPNLIKLD